MNTERWRQIDELFQNAVELDPARRADYLEQACAGDHALRSEIESMIASDSSGWSFVEAPVLRVAAPLLSDDQPQVSPDETIGHYRIVAPIGRGGMGEVYLAQDERLGRKVALKLLLNDFTSDPSRMRRFQQEARAASALNHPNILTIYDIGEFENRYFIASEFIDGETLRQRLGRQRIPTTEALNIGIQMASALSVAHQAGIVHRDIKPENIMLRRDGYVKMLDFGLAKLAGQQEPTTETGASERWDISSGLLMGTVKYMSPEQAGGQTVDLRSDIFSLGVVLYEMVTGRPPFEGETTRHLISAILDYEAAPLKHYAPEAPEELQIILSKALRKNRDERYESAGDLLADLNKLKNRFESRTPGQFIISEVRKHKASAILALSVLVLVIAGVGFGLFKFFAPKKGAKKPGTIKITELTNNGKARDAAISPDGKYVAYVVEDAGRESIWIRQVETDITSAIVSPVEVRLAALTFSREGNHLYYVKYNSQDKITNALYQVNIQGGDSKKIIEQVHCPVSFSPDGRQFAFFRRYGDGLTGENALLLANDDGTGERELARRKVPERFLDYPSGPAWSPDGKIIACGSRHSGRVELIEVRVADRSERTIGSQDWGGMSGVSWLPDGRGLLVAGTITGVNGSNNDVTNVSRMNGSEILRVSYPDGEVDRLTNDLDGYVSINSAADSPVLVTVRQTLAPNIWIVPTGDSSQARQITSGSSSYQGLCWTPDGKILYSQILPRTGANIWLMDADGTHQRQLTSESSLRSWFPRASRDGRYIVYGSRQSDVTSLWRMDIDGSNRKELIRGIEPFPALFTPDSKWVIVRFASGWSKEPIEGGDAVQLAIDGKAVNVAISPDGKWIAYMNSPVNAASPPQIVIVPFERPGPVKRLAVPTAFFGSWNLIKWAANGRSVLYVSLQAGTSNIWGLPIDGSAPKQLTGFRSEQINGFDLSADGKLIACMRTSHFTDVALMSGIDK